MLCVKVKNIYIHIHHLMQANCLLNQIAFYDFKQIQIIKQIFRHKDESIDIDSTIYAV